MSILAVIDTNVIVAALMSSHANSATVRVMNAVFDGIVTPLFTHEIIEEYRDVLSRPRLRLDAAKCSYVLSFIANAGKIVHPVASGLEMPDENDRVFLKTALAAADGAELVTGNLRHFPPLPFVLDPAGFCRIHNLPG